METPDTILEYYEAKARPLPTTPVPFNVMLRHLDVAVIEALNLDGSWYQVNRIQEELVAHPDCPWDMAGVDYYIRQTHFK